MIKNEEGKYTQKNTSAQNLTELSGCVLKLSGCILNYNLELVFAQLKQSKLSKETDWNSKA